MNFALRYNSYEEFCYVGLALFIPEDALLNYSSICVVAGHFKRVSFRHTGNSSGMFYKFSVIVVSTMECENYFCSTC